MDSALIVSGKGAQSDFLEEFLLQNQFTRVLSAKSASEAKRLLLERDVDLLLINTPLSDEFGAQFAVSAAQQGFLQVMLLVKNELFDEISEKVENFGVFTVAKPLSRQVIFSALKLIGASQKRMMGMQSENDLLRQKIEDIRLVDRAKCVLIEYLKMSEAQAHKYIEKQAMDLRQTRREVAAAILKTYES